MAPEICRVCGDNRALQNHDLCSNCSTDENLVGGPRCDLSAEEQHRLAQESGEMFEGAFRGDGR